MTLISQIIKKFKREWGIEEANQNWRIDKGELREI